MDAPNDFAGERIRTARAIFGLTQIQLARSVGVTQSQISSVESGARPASHDLIDDIASATGAPKSFFEVVPKELPLGSLRFRKTAGASRTETRRAEAVFGESFRVSNTLCKFGQYPEPDLPRMTAAPADGDIEDIAIETRQLLQLDLEGPIPHLIRACERAGIPIAPIILPGETSEESPTEIGHFGISYWAGEGERPLIGYFPGMRADRDRFTIAHELGHLVLHSGRPRSVEAEAEANKFASALLFPLSRATEVFSETLNLAEYARLKAIWGVSIQAMVMRAHQCRLISEERKTSLFKQISARGWRKNEPVVVHPEHPVLLWKLLDFAYGSSSLNATSSALAIPPVLLRALAPRPPEATERSAARDTRPGDVVDIRSQRRSL